MHLTDAMLRSYLDREGEADEQPAAADHLAVCTDCRERLAALAMRRAQVDAHLGALEPRPAERPRPAPVVLARLKARMETGSGKERAGMVAGLFSKRARPAWVGLGVLVILALALTLAPVRAWAGGFLGLFRVRQVTVLPVDMTRLSELGTNASLGRQISQLASHSVTVLKEPGDPKVAADAAEASRLAGFTVRLPANSKQAPRITVQDGVAFEFVVDRARAQAVLDEAGRSDLQLPASVDGATVKVEVPASVTAAYGDCPAQVSESDSAMGSPARRLSQCVFFVQMPSPLVTTPPDVDVAGLAQVGLQFLGMTADQAREFSQSVDWTSTLVVPIPRNAATYTQVPVDGVTGTLIERPADDAPQYLLLWVKDGTVYAIGGLGADTAAALQMAGSLK